VSTRRKRPSGNPARRTTGTGIRVEARHRHHAGIPTPRPGEHLWTVIGMWQVTNPTADRIDLDAENLLTIEGPGCYVCEQTWSPDIAAQPCPGDPS
jgi:hypothetical protein